MHKRPKLPVQTKKVVREEQEQPRTYYNLVSTLPEILKEGLDMPSAPQEQP